MKLGGDLIACVLGQVYSEVEKTMTGRERTPLMLEVGSAFQDTMEGRLVAKIERRSRRCVESFVSTHHSDRTLGGTCSSQRPCSRDPPRDPRSLLLA